MCHRMIQYMCPFLYRVIRCLNPWHFCLKEATSCATLPVSSVCAHVCEVNIGWDVMCGILGYPVVTILCTSVTWQHCGHCVVLYYQDYHGYTIIYREFQCFSVECRYFI